MDMYISCVHIFVVYKYILYIFVFVVSEKNQTLEVRYYYPCRAMAPHSSTLAWKIPWTEEPGGLQSMGSLRVGHD